MVLTVALLLLGPALPFAVAAPTPWDGVHLVVEAALVVWAGSRAHPRVWGAVWALLVAYSAALAGSRLGTDEALPLYDLALLLRPLVVVGADLYGWPLVVMAAALACVGPVAGAWWAGRALGRVGSVPLAPIIAAAVVLAVAGGPRSMLFSLGADLAATGQRAAAFAAERAARPHDDLADLRVGDVDVWVYVIESYGEVARDLPGGWADGVRALDQALVADGWVTASGRSLAPVHGGRSWISDASVWSGLFIASQADFERVSALSHALPTLPSWFAARGHRTLLIKPSDRARPGVQLENRFHFQETVFFDDLGYRGPAVGWGHIPDQFTLHVTHRDHLDGSPRPTFAFFHLATAHLPWLEVPPLLDDPMDWQARDGERAEMLKTREPFHELRLHLRRFRGGDQEPTIDRSAEASNYVGVVLYDLAAIVRQMGTPGPRRRLVVIYGDHQPAFLARGRSGHVPVHLIAVDRALLKTFFEAGFRDGMLPPVGGPSVEHRDLFALIARSAAAAR